MRSTEPITSSGSLACQFRLGVRPRKSICRVEQAADAVEVLGRQRVAKQAPSEAEGSTLTVSGMDPMLAASSPPVNERRADVLRVDALPPELPPGPAVIAGGAAAESLTLTAADGNEFAAALAESPAPSGPGS